MSDTHWHMVAQLSDIEEGKMIGVEVGEYRIVLCHHKEGVFALNNICSHAYALMHEGRLRGNRLICPLHGASFDCRSGAVLGAPATQPLNKYEVRVGNDGTIEVALPA
jgi:nitrite reductase/ring-hydroxylating ferredoxin subunit